MALASNNNLNPNKTVSHDDLEAIAKNAATKAAEKWVEERKQKLAELDDPGHAAKMAKAAADAKRQESGRWQKDLPWGTRADPLADKDIGEMTSLDKARMFARSVQCFAFAKTTGGGMGAAIERAKEAGQGTLVKALGAQDFDSGGFLVPPAFVEGFIGELTPREIYMRALPPGSIIDLPEGGATIPYEDDGADSQFVAENTEANAEEITGGQLVLQPRKQIIVVPASNDFLRGAPGKSDQFILQSMIKGMKTNTSATLLRGVGASNQFRGLSGLLKSANEFSVTAEAGLTQAILVEELLYMQTLVEEANVDLEADSPWYGMSPRSKNYLRAQRATDGKLFPEMETDKQILGAAYGATSNIPNNVSASYSEIYFVALAHMILAISEEMRFGVFEGGTYKDSSGTMVSGVSADQTVFSLIAKMDHAAGQRGNEIARANDVDWT